MPLSAAGVGAVDRRAAGAVAGDHPVVVVVPVGAGVGVAGGRQVGGEFLAEARSAGAEAAARAEKVVVVDGVGIRIRGCVPADDDRRAVVLVALVGRRPRRSPAERGGSGAVDRRAAGAVAGDHPVVVVVPVGAGVGVAGGRQVGGEFLAEARSAGAEAAARAEKVVVVDGVGIRIRGCIPTDDDRRAVVLVALVGRRPRRCAARLGRCGCRRRRRRGCRCGCRRRGRSRGDRVACGLDEPGSVTLRSRYEVVDHTVDGGIVDFDAGPRCKEQEAPATGRVDRELDGGARIGTALPRADDQPGAAYSVRALRAYESRPRDCKQQGGRNRQDPPRSATRRPRASLVGGVRVSRLRVELPLLLCVDVHDLGVGGSM